MTDIRAVLDSSAIRSYARGHIHVGEVITEVADESAYVGIPTTALLDAYAHCLGDKIARARLGVLIHLPGTQVLALDADAALHTAETVPFAHGDLSRAHAVWATLEHTAVYLTAEPDESARLVAEDRIIVVPGEDA
ncbi:hypothetical protein ACPCHT_23680 [Nucisporomicrobium flavum]|jgi:hypothetical protein|uniref:hypothetical protein n=1 Tax=Nucisporomicrobium flavum TaxID=2785915 RepID=UPI0018F54B77|nr:hypothetical protein [Nucisporomicrobium flavum]